MRPTDLNPIKLQKINKPPKLNQTNIKPNLILKLKVAGENQRVSNEFQQRREKEPWSLMVAVKEPLHQCKFLLWPWVPSRWVWLQLWLRSTSLSLLSYFLCCGCSGSVFVLLGVVGLGFEEGFALVLVWDLREN